jgi:hypothetical protein
MTESIMENWKRVVVAGSVGAAAVMFAKGKTGAGVILAGVSLATLASEYPEKFAEIRDRIPEFVERGNAFLEIVARAGERLAEATESRGAAWYEALLRS